MHTAKRFLVSFFSMAFLAAPQFVFAEDASIEKAVSLYNDAKYSEAADGLSACLNTEHNNPLLHYYLANCYAHLNKKEDALREYRITYALQPDSSAGKQALAAKEQLEGNNQTNPHDGTSNDASNVALKLGKPFKAEKPPAGGARLLLDSEDAHSKKVLFIGNVLTTTNQLPLVFAALVLNSNTSQTIRVGEVARESSTLKSSFNGDEAISIIKEEGPWTDIVLQEQSQIPLMSPEIMNQYALNFVNKNQKAGARTFLFETWCHKGKTGDQPFLSKAFTRCAKSTGAILLPVGEAFELVRKQNPALNLYMDDRHPSALGTYLAACVLYAKIFNRSPVGLPADMSLSDPTSHQSLSVMKIKQEDALALQNCAFQIATAPVPAILSTAKSTHASEQSIGANKQPGKASGTTNSAFDLTDIQSLPQDCDELSEKITLAQTQGVGTKTFSDAFSQLEQQVKAGERSTDLKQRVHSLSFALEAQMAQSKILQKQVPVAAPKVLTDFSVNKSAASPTKASYDTYIAQVERRIKRAWFPPKGIQPVHIVVTFKIHKSGDISEINVTDSNCPSIALDAAKKAVQNAAPFEHPPEGSEDPLDIRIRLETTVAPASR